MTRHFPSFVKQHFHFPNDNRGACHLVLRRPVKDCKEKILPVYTKR